MESKITYEVHPDEQVYFALKVIAAVAGYILIAVCLISFFALATKPAVTIIVFYAVLIFLYLIIRLGVMIGYIKGNAVRITKKQFPVIYEIIEKQCWHLGIQKIPSVFVQQNGGTLNAFATKFLGSNYVVIYSEVLEEAFEGNLETVEFILGHELGHVKRKHVSKMIWLFPSLIVPFLGKAYSRGCEYTCDNIGHAFNPKGSHKGLLLLAAGKKTWTRVNAAAFLEQERTETGFWFWFAEKLSTHPRLTKRLGRFRLSEIPQVHPAPVVKETIVVQKAEGDHSAYLPKN
jgi:Zn-dependent protease with chaperone function